MYLKDKCYYSFMNPKFIVALRNQYHHQIIVISKSGPNFKPSALLYKSLSNETTSTVIANEETQICKQKGQVDLEGSFQCYSAPISIFTIFDYKRIPQ
jgi:hypothetical protein